MSTSDTGNRLTPEPSGKPATNGKNGNGHDRAAFAGILDSAAAKRANGVGPQSRDLTLGELVAMVRTGWTIVLNRWVTAVIAALVVGIGLGYFVSKKTPENTAVTTMLAESTLDEILRGVDEGRVSAQQQENELFNHVSVLKSRRFSVALAKAFSENEKAAIMTPYLEPGAVLADANFEGFLAGHLDAERQRGREFFTLSFTHFNPDIAVMVADRMSKTYLSMVQQELKQANKSAAAVLKEQTKQMQDEIAELEKQQRDYRIEHNIISVQENQGILAERLKRIDQNRADARLARVRLQVQVSEAENDLSMSPTPFDNPLLSTFGNNQQLRRELDELNGQREVLATRYGSNHTKMRTIDATIRGIEENLKKNFDLAYRDLKGRYEDARIIERQLDLEFEEAFNDSIEMSRFANHYVLLGNEVDAKRKTFNDLLRRISRAGLSSKLPADVLRVIDPAYIRNPRITEQALFGAFTIFLAGLAFVGTPILLHLFDQRIKGVTDIESELGRELLGGIPKLSGTSSDDRAHIVRDNVDVRNVEPFMSVIAQLELQATDDKCRTYIVTSAVQGEGKSVIASNIAAGFTRVGKRTLIIDADCRRPTQGHIHQVENDQGFLAWARIGFPNFDATKTGRAPLGIRVLADGTHFLPSGGIDPQPTKYLVRWETAALFNELQRHYDIVIIDTPPVGFFQDALVLARFAQNTLLVTRESKAAVSQIRRVIADIDKTSAPILGVILNDFSSHNFNPRLANAYSYGSYYSKPVNGKKEKAATTGKKALTV